MTDLELMEAGIRVTKLSADHLVKTLLECVGDREEVDRLILKSKQMTEDICDGVFAETSIMESSLTVALLFVCVCNRLLYGLNECKTNKLATEQVLWQQPGKN